MKIPYTICQQIKSAMEYELTNFLEMQEQRNEQVIAYFQKRIKELDEYATSQQR